MCRHLEYRSLWDDELGRFDAIVPVLTRGACHVAHIRSQGRGTRYRQIVSKPSPLLTNGMTYRAPTSKISPPKETQTKRDLSRHAFGTSQQRLWKFIVSDPKPGGMAGEAHVGIMSRMPDAPTKMRYADIWAETAVST